MDDLISASMYRYQLQYCRTPTICTATQNIYFRTPPQPWEFANLDKSLPMVSNFVVSPRDSSLVLTWDSPRNRSDFGFYEEFLVSWCPALKCRGRMSFKTTKHNHTIIQDLDENTAYTVAVSTSYKTFMSPPERRNVMTKIGAMDPTAIAISDHEVLVFWHQMPSFHRDARYWIKHGNRDWFSTNYTSVIIGNVTSDSYHLIQTQYCTVKGSFCGEIRTLNVTTMGHTTDDTSSMDMDIVPTISMLNVSCTNTHTIHVRWTGDPSCDSYSGSACCETGHCSSFSSNKESATISNLMDLTMYNVSVWCVRGDRPGTQMTVMATTKVSSDLEKLTCESDTDSVILHWEPKKRALASNPKVWVMHPVQKKWLSTVDSMIEIDNLTSASFFELEIQYCASSWQDCGPSVFHRAKTLPGVNERYDLDRSMPNPMCVNVTVVTTCSADLSWSPVKKAVFYIVEARRCSPRGCPLDLSVTSKQTEVQLVGLEDLTKYTITVRTVKMEDGVYFSSSGTEVEVMTNPAPLTGFKAFSLFRSIELRWDPKMVSLLVASSDARDGYRDAEVDWLGQSERVIYLDSLTENRH